MTKTHFIFIGELLYHHSSSLKEARKDVIEYRKSQKNYEWSIVEVKMGVIGWQMTATARVLHE